MLKFDVSFQLTDKNKYPMSSNHSIVIILLIYRNVTHLSIPGRNSIITLKTLKRN